jgi:flagellar assembly protein FliH
MSLSKYYKNAPSFQAEDLVSQKGKTSSGWTPDPRKNDRPFKTKNTLPPTTPNSPSCDQPTSPSRNSQADRNCGDDKPNGSSLPSASENGNILSVTQENGIDLNRYIERTEAEEKTDEAYQQGIKEGLDKAERDFGTGARALLVACQHLDTLRTTIITNSSKELLDFALTIAERIIRLSVRKQDHTIIATIEEALRRAVKSDEFTIHIHPDDYDAVTAKSAEIVAGLSGLNNIVVRKDNTIERGGARIDSDNCTIDATIACQFEAIREEVEKSI